MRNTEDNKGRPPLDTFRMQEKLKGDSFPQDWDEYLDDDIRSFFDTLLSETGQKSKPVPHLRVSTYGGAQAGKARLLSADCTGHVT